jgi:regulator of sigma E protease
VHPDERHRSFFAQKLWRRMIIVLAGPAMNLIFPLALFFLVALGADALLTPPVVGSVRPGMPADGLLLPGDRILAVNGQEVHSFSAVSRIVREHPGDLVVFEVDREPFSGRRPTRGDSQDDAPPRRMAEVLTAAPGESPRIPELGVVERVGLVGISPASPLPVVGVTSPSSLAARAGIRTFDRILGLAGTRIENLREARAPLSARSMIPTTVLRAERVQGALGGLVELDVYRPHFTSLVAPPGAGDPIQRVGLESAATYVAYVRTGSAEHRMGLLPGDRIVTVDGQVVRVWTDIVEALSNPEHAEHQIRWRRGDRLHEGRLVLPRVRGSSAHGALYGRVSLGIDGFRPVTIPPAIAPESAFLYASRVALDETRRMVELTVYSLLRLFQGRITVKSIGGPISVYEETGRAASEGTSDYLRLMAFVSVNLGILNLLPIPMLDGGHLLFFLLEAVLRRPVSRRRREQAGLVGLALLLLMMGIAFKNDIERLWPSNPPPHTAAP